MIKKLDAILEDIEELKADVDTLTTKFKELLEDAKRINEIADKAIARVRL